MKMKKKCVLDKTEVQINDDGSIQPIAYKGRMVNMVDLDKEFLSHKFNPLTLKIMFYAQFDIDYVGN